MRFQSRENAAAPSGARWSWFRDRVRAVVFLLGGNSLCRGRDIGFAARLGQFIDGVPDVGERAGKDGRRGFSGDEAKIGDSASGHGNRARGSRRESPRRTRDIRRGSILWLGFVLGLIGTAILIFVPGYLDSRANHGEFIRERFAVVVERREAFESEIERIGAVFHGQSLPGGADDYAAAAWPYIRSMETVEVFLPETSDEFSEYFDAIVNLRKYFDEETPPSRGTAEWVLFYGTFRRDYARYIGARNEYYNAVADELGDHVRHALNL